MKIRSSLLFACMLVVPLIAMFSHKIPPDLRLSARRHIWDPARKSILHAFGGAAETPVVPSPTTVAVSPAEPMQRVFQASEPDPISALHNLLEQVQLWKQRMAAAPPAGQSPPAQTRRFQ